MRKGVSAVAIPEYPPPALPPDICIGSIPSGLSPGHKKEIRRA